MTTPDIQNYRTHLQCSFGQLEECFDDCINDALRQLSEQGIADYLDGASLLCKIGRGLEPVLVLINDQKFTKTANCWGVDNNFKGTNTNRIVLFRKP